MYGLFASRAIHGAKSARWMLWGLAALGLPITAAMLVTSFTAQLATAATPCAPIVRTADEIWFVDTRSASCSAANSHLLPKVAVQQRIAAGNWQQAQLTDLLASDPTVQTVIWVHGNRVGSSEARQHGWEFYQNLTRQADQRPLRLVIWAWPADQIRGPAKDVRYKAMLSVPAAYQLARFLRHMDPATPLGLAGFSFGARVITGAMHLQAGGSLGAYRLPKVAGVSGPSPRAVLWASALNDDWLMPGHYHGQALQQLEHATFLNNSCDRALKRYRFIDRCSRPEALGYWGVAGIDYLGSDKAKIEQVDVCCVVGKVHSDCTYIYSSNIMGRTWRGLVETAVVLPALAKAPAAKLPAVAKTPKPVAAPSAVAVKK